MPTIPYKIAVLVYVFNDAGELLLLHRKKEPNRDLYSPIGGKLEQASGESPYACALREIAEEIAVQLNLADLRLAGIVSERAFLGGGLSSQAHWLMFCFEVRRRLNFPARQIAEGRLEWIHPAAVSQLNIPQTDREVIWPLMQQHSLTLNPAAGEKVFSVHIDCTDDDAFVVTYES